ncbi:ABC transporter ATP-binding protein [Rhabdobacter roseus]|uniref:Iron(III) transport system ATP-binding protein n=1 Tax=Rhabdobacter roseus TaxID=1655419 RepID=A0A840TKH0_9BACT|nr:ABC transporter ATP-binding protein [Rhabdobacter roseus]MBB5283435.1 iron(III) transport system ATP-binding protein [Rhabdobacter roseus]
MAVLRARAITKRFDDKTVLSGISLDLKKNEWLGILGESGSGKSTLLRIMARLLDADEGEVYLGRDRLPDVSTQLIAGHAGIKHIHQEFELFPNQTVRENIAYALRFYEPDFRDERVEDLLELTQLGPVRDQKAKLLSGGEKQRTAIARSLAELPEVLLLDEPFAHLDSRNRQAILEAIQSIRRRHHLSCVFVTHEAADALAWCDRVAVLRAGQLVQVGTPEEIYDHPANAYVAELTGVVNWLPAERPESGKYFVRPEWVKVTKNSARATWRGTLAAVRFRGSFWEYLCYNGRQEAMTFYAAKSKLNVGEELLLTYPRSAVRYVE